MHYTKSYIQRLRNMDAISREIMKAPIVWLWLRLLLDQSDMVAHGSLLCSGSARSRLSASVDPEWISSVVYLQIREQSTICSSTGGFASNIGIAIWFDNILQ